MFRWGDGVGDSEMYPDSSGAYQLLRREVASLPSIQVELLAPPSADLATQVRVALDLGVPYGAPEIRERVTKAAQKYLPKGSWILGAAFRERSRDPDFGSFPRAWALVADTGFVLATGSTVFFAEPHEVHASVDVQVTPYADGPSAICSWMIMCGSFLLSGGINDPRLPQNNIATGLHIQRELLSGRWQRPS